MAKLKKITEGLTGEVCADIIYENDQLLEKRIKETNEKIDKTIPTLNQVTNEGNTTDKPLIVQDGDYVAILDKDSLSFSKKGVILLTIDVEELRAEGSAEVTQMLKNWIGTNVENSLESESTTKALSAAKGKELENRKSDKYFHSDYIRLSELQLGDDLSGKELIFDTSVSFTTPADSISILLSGNYKIENNTAYCLISDSIELDRFYDISSSTWKFDSYIMPEDAGEVTAITGDISQDNALISTKVSIKGETIETVESNYKALIELDKKLGSNNLQDITENGNTTYKDLILNGAVIGADKFGNIRYGENTALHIQAGSNSTFIGSNAASLLKNTALDTFIGSYAGVASNNSQASTIIGTASAGKASILFEETFVGSNSAGKYIGGEYTSTTPTEPLMQSGQNVFIGRLSGYKMLFGRGNTFVGSECGYDFLNLGEYNTFLGAGVTKGYRQVYGNSSIIIGAYAPLPYNMGLDNKLIIHAKRPEEPGTAPLVYGDFREKWFQINGKYILNYNYTPSADKEPEEGEEAFTPTKMLVADEKGNVGVKKIISPETPITNIFMYTKNYFSAYFSHPFTNTSEIVYIKIQNQNAGVLRNLTIKGRLIVEEAFQEFELIASINYIGFSNCFYKTVKSEDMITSIGLIYYENGEILIQLEGSTKYSKKNTSIIIDQISALNGSTNIEWYDEELVIITSGDIDIDKITAKITAQLIS